MSLIDHVLKPVGLSWLHKKPPVELSDETIAPRMPSLASIEYELNQLRGSLDGVIDFGAAPLPSFLTHKNTEVPLSTGLKRSDTHRQKLIDAAV